MASKDFNIIDLQDNDGNLNTELNFQDFGSQSSSGNQNLEEDAFHFSDFPASSDEDLGKDKPMLNVDDPTASQESSESAPSFWNFKYYQQLFDVDSKQVGDRIVWSMIPKPGVNYLQAYIRPNPDLYGPFWICLTLVFTTAITGNLANYLQTSVGKTYVWRYDFHKVTFAASAIFAYAWLVPLILYAVLHWRRSKANISLLELLCVYGYALAIFVPVSILWMIPQPWFQWCLAIVAPVLSGSVLVRTIWPGLSHDAKQVAVGLSVIIIVLHMTLAFGFMLYFFSPPERSVAPAVVSNNTYIVPPQVETNTVKRNIPSVAPSNQEDNSATGPVRGQVMKGTDSEFKSEKGGNHSAADSAKNVGAADKASSELEAHQKVNISVAEKT